jgi:hypothetical protein
MNAQLTISAESLLAEQVSRFYADPYGFVKFAYPWGMPGPLECFKGPDKWQRDFLIELGAAVLKRQFDGFHSVMPIRETTASGHGIGKTVLVAFIVDWLMSTRPHAKGTITANTFIQLRDKTWATIQAWTKMCITGHWFEVTNGRMYKKEHSESWFCAPQTCKEENSEAFAGQHNVRSTSFYIFDEASAVPDKIWEVAEGGLTDGEPMIFAFGNPTRSQGKFHNFTFGAGSNRWNTRSIDSRTCAFSNKELIREWVEDYGEDSDFVRVRVRGVPPRADDSQFIDLERITNAQKRAVFTLTDEPLIAGVDLAWGGSDFNVVRFRCGKDARSIKPIVIPGEHTRDASVMTVKLADVLRGNYNGKRVHTMFLDSAGISGAITPRLQQLGFQNVVEINFGGDAPDRHYRYMRDYMWGLMKEWLLTGAIDAPNVNSSRDPANRLELELATPGIRNDAQQRVWLESKDDIRKRLPDFGSPDHADALALTFARPVALAPKREAPMPRAASAWS